MVVMAITKYGTKRKFLKKRVKMSLNSIYFILIVILIDFEQTLADIWFFGCHLKAKNYFS